MVKSVNNVVLDGAFDILDQANLMLVCSDQPSSRTNAIALALADAPLTPNLDFVKTDGDFSGRKLTILAKNNIVVDKSGIATHIALVNDTTLLYVTTCDSLAVTALNTLNLPAWDVEISDPA